MDQQYLGNAYVAEPQAGVCVHVGVCGANACAANAGGCGANACAANASGCGVNACTGKGGVCGADACGGNAGACAAKGCGAKAALVEQMLVVVMLVCVEPKPVAEMLDFVR